MTTDAYDDDMPRLNRLHENALAEQESNKATQRSETRRCPK